MSGFRINTSIQALTASFLSSTSGGSQGSQGSIGSGSNVNTIRSELVDGTYKMEIDNKFYWMAAPSTIFTTCGDIWKIQFVIIVISTIFRLRTKEIKL